MKQNQTHHINKTKQRYKLILLLSILISLLIVSLLLSIKSNTVLTLLEIILSGIVIIAISVIIATKK